jgi:transposase
MRVTERVAGDREKLEGMIRRERNAKQRDRLRAAAMALDGEEKESIAGDLKRSKSFVEDWAYAYRDGGLGAIRPRKPTGRPAKLAKDQERAFLDRVDAGPTAEDGVCTLRGVDLQRILREEHKAEYSERGVYALMKRLGYSSLKPRPIHEKHDPVKAEQFKADAPFLSAKKRRGVRARSCV